MGACPPSVAEPAESTRMAPLNLTGDPSGAPPLIYGRKATPERDSLTKDGIDHAGNEMGADVPTAERPELEAKQPPTWKITMRLEAR